MSGYGLVEKLRAAHDLEAFDCGKEPLNRFLKRHALTSQQAESAATYVACRGKVVVGYYSLAAGSVSHEAATHRLRKCLAHHAIPVVLLARLAVDLHEQGQGLGAALLKDALRRAAQAADVIGARALLVHALDEEARRFYLHFDFEPSQTDPDHLFLIMKELKRLIGR